MTDPQPLTGDELATIKARAEAASGGGKWNNRDLPHVVDMCESRDVYAVVHRDVGEDVKLPRVIAEHIAGMDPATTLRLVAEIERLQAQVVRATSPVSLVGPIASPDYTMRAGWSHDPLPDRNTRVTVVDCL